MGLYGHKSLRCKDFYNFTMAGFGRLRSTDCGSHGRGPRFDPLCVHQLLYLKQEQTRPGLASVTAQQNIENNPMQSSRRLPP